MPHAPEPIRNESERDAGEAPRPMSESQQVAERIEDLSPADGAEVLVKLPPRLSADVSEYLDPVTAAGILAQLDASQAAEVIRDMNPPEASMVLEAMDPDDRVDILDELPRDVHEMLLGEMTAADAREVRELEKYSPDTAGGIMTTQVTSLPEDLTVEQAIEELRRLNEEIEQMFYVYVVDRERRLVGVLSMRDLIFARPQTRLSRIMRPNVVTVPATMDQEEVAALLARYDYLAVPVVDDNRRLLGLITVDDVMDVIQEEATEDVQRLFGAGAEERLGSPWTFSFRMRLVWLVVNLATAFLAAAVVGAFQQTIQTLVALTIYMPIVAGMGGNAGAQAMAVTIRGLAVGQVDRALLRHVLWREMIVGLLTGIVIGIITGGVAVYANGSWQLGLVVGLALIITHTLACTSGAIIPLVMKGLGFDPAQSASIFATTVTDVAGFFSLLGLARLMLI